MKQRVPVEHRQHERGQRVGHEHLPGGDHVRALIDRREDADEGGKPGLDRQQQDTQRQARVPRDQKHAEGGNWLVDRDRCEQRMVAEQNDHKRQHLNVERAKRCGGNHDDRVQRRMFHHGGCRPL